MNERPVPFATNDQYPLSGSTVGEVSPVAQQRRVVTRRPSPKVAAAPVTRDTITVPAYSSLVESWLAVCDQERHTPATIASRAERTGRLQWFLLKQGYQTVGVVELRAFFNYLNHAHEKPPYRWDNPKCIKPLAPGRVNSFHSSLRTFFNWLVEEKRLDESPMVRIKPAIDRADQVEPFTETDCLSLLAAARQTTAPYRDVAILSLLLDTGMRASELCSLTVDDVLLDKCRAVVRNGKGGKKRTVPFDTNTRRAIHEYIHNERGQAEGPGEALFITLRGRDAGDGITPNGLGQLFDRLKLIAHIEGVRCSPHTCRHTFAISFLRAGGNSLTLQTI